MDGITQPVSLEHSSQSTLDVSLRLPVLFGSLAVLGSLGGLIIWSYMAIIASAIIVPGVVVVDSGRKSVQHVNGGTIKSIEVHEGQEVKAGQVLIRLDPDNLEFAYESLERLLAINVASESRLHAEQDGLREISFLNQPEFVSSSEWLNAKGEQVRLFSMRQTSLKVKVQTLRSDGLEALSVSDDVKDQASLQKTRILLTQQELANAELLARSGYGTRQRVLEVKRSVAELESELSSLQSKEVDTEQTFAHDCLAARQIVSSFAEDAGSDLQQVERDHADLLLKIRTLRQEMAGLDMKAPVSGRVVNIGVHTIGGVVIAGSTALEIVPDGDALVLEAKVRPDDIEGVTLGSPVDVRLTGFNGQRLPRIVGSVTRISADRIEDPVHGTPFFRVRAEVNRDNLGKMGLHEFRAGMPITLMIREGQQTPLAYLTSPLIAFFTRPLR